MLRWLYSSCSPGRRLANRTREPATDRSGCFQASRHHPPRIWHRQSARRISKPSRKILLYARSQSVNDGGAQSKHINSALVHPAHGAVGVSIGAQNETPRTATHVTRGACGEVGVQRTVAVVSRRLEQRLDEHDVVRDSPPGNLQRVLFFELFPAFMALGLLRGGVVAVHRKLARDSSRRRCRRCSARYGSIPWLDCRGG